MPTANEIVTALLETDEEPHPADAIDPKEYLSAVGDELASGVVNAISAQTANTFYHRTKKYKDGKTPLQVRRNGKTKTWKREPNKFRIPVKYGMYEFFYIDNINAPDWSTIPDPPASA